MLFKKGSPIIISRIDQCNLENLSVVREMWNFCLVLISRTEMVTSGSRRSVFRCSRSHFFHLEAQCLFPDKSSRAPIKCNRADCWHSQGWIVLSVPSVERQDLLGRCMSALIRVFATHDHFQGMR